MKKTLMQSIFCSFGLFFSSISIHAMDANDWNESGPQLLCSDILPLLRLSFNSDEQVINYLLEILRQQINAENPDGDLIDAVLGSLGDLFFMQKMEQIPDEIISFLDKSVLVKYHIGENIILHAGRCIDNLTLANGLNRIAPSSDILQR